jgi:predicted GNAT family acetyltransferase
MSHILDRPVWNALATRQATLAEGGPLARRFPDSIVPFAASRDGGDESMRALARLATPGGAMFLVEAGAVKIPEGFATVTARPLVQMIATRKFAPVADARIERLTDADAAEMVELAALTRPGPLTLRAQALGTFWAVRVNGRIAAMAGERMKQDGFSEVSGVCTHPGHRGQGLARLLSRHVAGLIAARGETPYLHTFATNDAAIALYQSIGFEIRATLNLAVIQPAAADITA